MDPAQVGAHEVEGDRVGRDLNLLASGAGAGEVFDDRFEAVGGRVAAAQVEVGALGVARIPAQIGVVCALETIREDELCRRRDVLGATRAGRDTPRGLLENRLARG